MLGVIGLERVEASAAKPGIHSSWPRSPGCASERCRRPRGSRDDFRRRRRPAAARTPAGRAPASDRTPRCVSATWPPATSARAIHGRPADLPGSSSAGCRIASASSAMPSAASCVDHLPDAIDALTALLREKRQQARRTHVDEVAEHVHVGAVDDRGDFDAGDELDARPRAARRRGLAQPATVSWSVTLEDA